MFQKTYNNVALTLSNCVFWANPQVLSAFGYMYFPGMKDEKVSKIILKMISYCGPIEGLDKLWSTAITKPSHFFLLI